MTPIHRYCWSGWSFGIAVVFSIVAVALLGYAVGVGPKWMVRR